MEPAYIKLKEIKPVLTGYVRDALQLLKRAPVPDENAIHDIRVLMKKSRAAMKLISGQVDDEFFTREYATFREVGRIMSSWRDTSVHRKTIKGLRKSHRKLFSALSGNEKLATLLKKPDIATTDTPYPEMGNGLERIEELLQKSGYRIRFQSFNNLDPLVLFKSLDETYNMVSEKYLICRNNSKPANIHELRKKVKDFLYQLTFFRPLNPSSVKSLEKKIDELAQSLGKVNDLNQLLAAVDYKHTQPSLFPAMDELILHIRDEQDRYLFKIWPLAFKIFCPGQQLVNLLGFKILLI